MASRRRNDSSHDVWPSSANTSVFSFTSLSSSGSFFCLNCTSVSVDRAEIAPTFVLTRREGPVVWFVVKFVPNLRVNTRNNQPVAVSGSTVFSIFSFSFGSLSLADQRLIMMSASC